jgi:hypothetical protein
MKTFAGHRRAGTARFVDVQADVAEANRANWTGPGLLDGRRHLSRQAHPLSLGRTIQ